MDKVICIVGPTGIGKTKLSLELASWLDTEIINGDAIQVFKSVDILSAKVSIEEQGLIKHYLLDFLELDEIFDVALFKNEATKLIRMINQAGKIPIIVGGSGFYLKSLLYDYTFSDIAGRNNEDMSKYESFSNEDLFAVLERIDYEASVKLHPNNRKRVLRAIEIFEANDIKKTDLIKQQQHCLEFDALIIGLKMDRTRLYDIINQRVEKMLEQGLVAEVNNLHKQHPNQEYQVFQAIGYKELVPYLDGIVTLDEAVALIKQNSRRYAKKQLTWFNNQMKVNWLESNTVDFKQTSIKAKLLVKEFMEHE